MRNDGPFMRLGFRKKKEAIYIKIPERNISFTDITEIKSIAKVYCKHKPLDLIINLSNIRAFERLMRVELANLNVSYFRSMTFISPTVLQKLMVSIYLKSNRPNIPSRSVSNLSEALTFKGSQ